MPIGLNSIFDIGRKGLRANLAGLNVSGNNIANVNTEGYSRQQIAFDPSYPFKTPQGIFGTGVEVASIRRVRNEIIDRQIRKHNSPLGYFEEKQRIYKQIENIFNEPNGVFGIREQIEKFFDNFHELANDPESGSTRTVILEHGKTLIESIKRIDDQLVSLSSDVSFQIGQKVDEINNIAQSIAGLNEKIVAAENLGGTANTLRDKRDLEIDKLSKMVTVYFKEDSSGAVNIAISGNSLVSDGERVSTLEKMDFNNGVDFVTKIFGSESGLEFKPNSGELSGLLEIRNEVVPLYRERFDSIIASIITQVNSLHRNGVGIKGSLSEVPHDNDFFAGTGAKDIDLSDAVKESINNIAAAERVETLDGAGNTVISGAPGDNKIALQIANLKGILVFENNTETFDDYLAKTIGQLGIGAKNVDDNASRQKLILAEFENLRDSTSGVSIDEELTHLIRFQRGYQASARVISTVDELFDTLINMV